MTNSSPSRNTRLEKEEDHQNWREEEDEMIQDVDSPKKSRRVTFAAERDGEGSRYKKKSTPSKSTKRAPTSRRLTSIEKKIRDHRF